jgi:hypothetical protein
MSIKTNLIPGISLTEQVLNSAADSAIRGFKDEAIEKFKESGLNKEQMLKVTKIIEIVNSDGSIAELANLKDRILDDLTKQSTPEIVVPQKTTFADCIVFKDMIPDNQWFGCFTALPNDIVTTIFMRCVHTSGLEGITNLSMTCKHLYQKIRGPKPASEGESFAEQLILAEQLSIEQKYPGFTIKQKYPELTILDLDPNDIFKFTKYNKSEIFNACDKLLSKGVLGNRGATRGVTLIAMPKGLTLVDLLNKAVKEEVAVSQMVYSDNKNFKRISCFDSSKEPSYLVLIVDSGFSRPLDATSHEKRCALVKKEECELPRLEELLALHIFRPELAQMQEAGESVFWSCSNTFSLGKESAWGIEHYVPGYYDRFNRCMHNIQICTYGQSLRSNNPPRYNPPRYSCQGVIRFFPSKK